MSTNSWPLFAAHVYIFDGEGSISSYENGIDYGS